MNLQAWRKSQELTQTELAELLGTNQGHVSELESGVHKPTLAMLLTVSKITKGKVGLQDWVPVPKKVWKKPQITTRKGKR